MATRQHGVAYGEGVNQPRRDECVHLLARKLGQGESVVLLAPPGSGRTTVLDSLQRSLGCEVALVRARESVPGIPFVPFAQVLVDSDAPLDEPLRIYTELPLALAERPLVVLVDDGDGLDRASAVLVAQLHRAGVPCAVVLPGRNSGPEGLAETCSKWAVVEVAPLGLPEVAQLAEELLGSPLIAPCVAELAALASGLPAVITGILQDASREGLLEQSAAGTRLRRFPVADRMLRYARADVERVLPFADTLEAVAVAEWVPTAVFDAEHVGVLARMGVVSTDNAVVTITDPLVGAWALGRLGADQRRHRLREISERVGALGDERWAEHVEILSGAAGDGPDPVASSRWLAAEGRLDDADLLLEQAETDAGWERSVVRAEVDIALGRSGEAVVTIDAVEHLAATESQARTLVRLWNGALGGRLVDHDGLKERVERVLPRFTDPAERALIAAAFERRRAIVGRGERVAETDDPVSLALRESMTGSLDRARTMAGASRAGQEGAAVDEDEQLKVLAHFLSLVYGGQLREGRELAERHHRLARAEARPALGLWTYNLSKIAFHAGQYDESARLALEARRHLAWRDVAGQALPTEAMYAAALARLGRVEQAEGVIATLAPEERLLPRVAIGVARVEAERLRGEGRIADAARSLAAAGEYAVANDEAHSGLLAVDESFMLAPEPGIAALLDSLRDKSALVAAFADRAQAVIEADPDALGDVAARFEEMIQPGRAAHAWAVAAELHRARGRNEQARRCTQNAVRVCSHWRVTPWPVEAADDGVLTEREWEVARRAARRERSREIAEDLGLSVRTVDNHLARAYRKLGIAGRDELADALELTS